MADYINSLQNGLIIGGIVAGIIVGGLLIFYMIRKSNKTESSEPITGARNENAVQQKSENAIATTDKKENKEIKGVTGGSLHKEEKDQNNTETDQNNIETDQNNIETDQKNIFGDNTLERNIPYVKNFMNIVLKSYSEKNPKFFDDWGSGFRKFLSKVGSKTIDTLKRTPNLTAKQQSMLKEYLANIAIVITSTAYYENTILKIGDNPEECLNNLLAHPPNMLENIYLADCNLSRFNIVIFGFFTHLKHLSLFFSTEGATPDSIECLAPYLQELEEIDITGSQLKKIPNLKSFPKLKIIRFAHCADLTIGNIDTLSLFDSGIIWFKSTGISRDMIIELAKRYPNITFKCE